MYKVEIDFEAASKAWTQNKTRPRNSQSYVYRCGYIKSDGKPCKNICKRGYWEICRFHRDNCRKIGL